MAEFVIFTLAAPMGAFADLAGHERRHSGTWPARSAVLGLVGAALGVRRNEAARQQSLSRWRTAVSVLSRALPSATFTRCRRFRRRASSGRPHGERRWRRSPAATIP